MYPQNTHYIKRLFSLFAENKVSFKNLYSDSKIIYSLEFDEFLVEFKSDYQYIIEEELDGGYLRPIHFEILELTNVCGGEEELILSEEMKSDLIDLLENKIRYDFGIKENQKALSIDEIADMKYQADKDERY
jgi:hypothetical protein